MRYAPVLLRGLGCGKHRTFDFSFPYVLKVCRESQVISAFKTADGIETKYVPYTYAVLLIVNIDMEKYRFGSAHVKQ